MSARLSPGSVEERVRYVRGVARVLREDDAECPAILIDALEVLADAVEELAQGQKRLSLAVPSADLPRAGGNKP